MNGPCLACASTWWACVDAGIEQNTEDGGCCADCGHAPAARDPLAEAGDIAHARLLEVLGLLPGAGCVACTPSPAAGRGDQPRDAWEDGE